MELESWSRSIPNALRSVIPFFGMMPPKAGVIPIRALRGHWLAFSSYLGMILIVLLFIETGLGTQGTMGWIVLAVGSVSSVVFMAVTTVSSTGWMRQVETLEQADRVYSQRMMLRMVYAITPGLIGFVVVFLNESLLPFLVGLAVSIPLLIWMAPRSADVRRLQEMLRQQGSSVDLVAALTTPRTWSARDQRSRRRRR